MSIRLDVDRSVLQAPCDGVVSFAAPRAFAGELELFRRGDVLGSISHHDSYEELTAPFDGFILRYFVRDGELVAEGSELLVLREVR
jgi:hypothetical protein